MPASLTASTRARLGWSAVVVSLAMTWLASSRVLQVDGIPHPHGLGAWIDLSFWVTPLGAGIASVAYLVSLGCIAADRARAAACAAVAVLLALATHVAECQWEADVGASHTTAMGGAAMAAYFLTRAWHRKDPGAGERRAIEAMVGVVAASYLLAGSSKLVTSGLGWAEGRHLALHVASHAIASPSPLSDFRLAVAEHVELETLLGVGTLLIECSFVLFLVPRMRAAYAVLSTVMHASIGLLMGLHHEEWSALVVGLALLSPGDARPRQEASATTATMTTIHSGSK